MDNELKVEPSLGEQQQELLYHYCFNIDDLALNRFGLSNNQILTFRTLLLTTLAETVAKEMSDNWLFVQDENKHVVLYGGQDENQDSIIEYYLTKDKIPEDTLYLGENGIELYSRNVKKIELHKAELEMLSENIHELIDDLMKIDESTIYLDEQIKKSKKIEVIIDYFEKSKKKTEFLKTNKLK